jgi:hypothetical protein
MELDTALKQSQRALDASIENARLDQRPWIVVANVKWESELKAGETNLFAVTIRNAGKTPAQHVRAKYTTRIDKPEGYIVDHMDGEELAIGPAGVFVWSGSIVPPRLTQEALTSLESGTHVLTIVAEITYQDVFGGGKLHRTRSCNYYKAENKPYFTPCDTGNYIE